MTMSISAMYFNMAAYGFLSHSIWVKGYMSAIATFSKISLGDVCHHTKPILKCIMYKIQRLDVYLIKHTLSQH